MSVLSWVERWLWARLVGLLIARQDKLFESRNRRGVEERLCAPASPALRRPCERKVIRILEPAVSLILPAVGGPRVQISSICPFVFCRKKSWTDWRFSAQSVSTSTKLTYVLQQELAGFLPFVAFRSLMEQAAEVVVEAVRS